jgi:hypothetical protein
MILYSLKIICILKEIFIKDLKSNYKMIIINKYNMYRDKNTIKIN